MAVRYDVDPASRTVLVVFSGRSSMDETIRMRQALLADARFRDTYNELVDLQEFCASDSDFRDFQARGKLLDPFSKFSLRAVVAPSDFAFAMARMYAAVREPEARFAIFRSMPDACDWLQLDQTARQRLSLITRHTSAS